jgi:hypothetical protein
MNFNRILNLESTTRTYNLSAFFPLDFTITPTNLTESEEFKIKKIVYNWPDNTQEIVEFKPSFKFDNFSSVPEFYNPRKTNVKKTFTFDKNYIEQNILKKIIINVYFFGKKDYDTYTINLVGFKPKIFGNIIDGDTIFNNIFLVDARMFGPDNELLYVFETEDPNYILMSTVTWEKLIEKREAVKLPPIRPYKFLMPFNKVVFDTISDLENVPYQTPTSIQIDNGGNYI